MFKRGKDNGHDTGFKCKFKYSFLIFSNICCWCTLELPHSVNLQHMSFTIIKCFTISFFLNKFSTTFIASLKCACRNEQVLCSLSCTWMTILDCLFYAFDSLS